MDNRIRDFSGMEVAVMDNLVNDNIAADLADILNKYSIGGNERISLMTELVMYITERDGKVRGATFDVALDILRRQPPQTEN